MYIYVYICIQIGNNFNVTTYKINNETDRQTDR